MLISSFTCILTATTEHSSRTLLISFALNSDYNLFRLNEALSALFVQTLDFLLT